MPQPHDKEKEWTVIFYLASDNPLAPSIVSQLKAIKDAGYHPEANVVVHFDPHTTNTPTHVFDVNYVEKLKASGASQVGHAADPAVKKLVLDKLWGEKDAKIRESIGAQIDAHLKKTLGASNNGFGSGGAQTAATMTLLNEQANKGVKDDLPPVLAKELSGEAAPENSLKNFLRFCKQNYPARHYILFLLGHGLVVGNKMFMLDEHTASDPGQPDGKPGRAAHLTNGRPPFGILTTNGRPPSPSVRDKGEGDVASSLTLAKLIEALDEIQPKVEPGSGEPIRLELIGFHSCSMSGLEVAYELRNRARYMMASQGPAFVGSWPYRHILLRLFNHLNSELREEDLKDVPGLVTRLRAGADPVTKYVLGKLDNDEKRMLSRFDGTLRAQREIRAPLCKGLRKVMDDQGMCEAEGVEGIAMSPRTRRLFARARARGREVSGANRARLNRLLLADASGGALTPNPASDDASVRELFKDFFYSVLYNSSDFQLAGYSFDLCLCDLRRVGALKETIGKLADALKGGMAGDRGLARAGRPHKSVPLARELVLLAHWDAQSFWQESYTDLYDFCYRLMRRCQHISSWEGGMNNSPAFAPLRKIIAACEEVIKELTRSTEDDEDKKRAVVLAEFAGPEYQYSHGLSVYFPWSRPTDGFFKRYKDDYAFGVDTRWADFLDIYFDMTQRESFGEENPAPPAKLLLEEVALEALLSDIGARAFDDGQLAKGAGNDATGAAKGAGNDAAGDCDCPTIKNYPPFIADPSPVLTLPNMIPPVGSDPSVPMRQATKKRVYSYNFFPAGKTGI